MASIIGITTSFENGQQRLQHTYIQAVERAGGIPYVIPMVESQHIIGHIVDTIDALIITGGPAITEGLIGELPEDIDETAPERIKADNALLDSYEQTNKPILGICYGMQLLNARDGGTIFSDAQAQVKDALVHSSVRGAPDHPIDIAKDSILFDLLRTRSISVNSRHIQAVARVGASYHITATAPDGITEAFENEDGSVIGVQFHPEKMGDSMAPLFDYLIRCTSNQLS